MSSSIGASSTGGREDPKKKPPGGGRGEIIDFDMGLDLIIIFPVSDLRLGRPVLLGFEEGGAHLPICPSVALDEAKFRSESETRCALGGLLSTTSFAASASDIGVSLKVFRVV